MGAPLRRGWGGLDPIEKVLQDIIDASGDISADEAKLLAAIRARLANLELGHGRKAAREAAGRIREIWLQAIEDDEDPWSRLGLN